MRGALRKRIEALEAQHPSGTRRTLADFYRDVHSGASELWRFYPEGDCQASGTDKAAGPGGVAHVARLEGRQ